jgi:hypothetical protein
LAVLVLWKGLPAVCLTYTSENNEAHLTEVGFRSLAEAGEFEGESVSTASQPLKT